MVHSYSKPTQESTIFAELTSNPHNPIHKFMQLDMLVLNSYLAILPMYTFLQLFNSRLQFLDLNPRFHNLHSNHHRRFLAFHKTRTAAQISTVRPYR